MSHEFEAAIDPGISQSVRSASRTKTEARRAALGRIFGDPEAARQAASEAKAAVLNNLGSHLRAVESQLLKNGCHVHWAATADSACQIISEICVTRSEGEPVVKGKSMVTEEIHLNDFLLQKGVEVIETDLGEFVVQLDGDRPSHIVTPIIHKTRHDVAQSFTRAGLGPHTTNPEDLASQARRHLRQEFRSAKVGISGVNFAIAETGHLVIVENEGNNRLSTTAVKCHIAVMGIEKVLARFADLALFLPLLASAATGQAITTYVNMVVGPRASDGLDGPDEVHVVLLDNGRSRILASENRDILKCIRCGACLNVCPVYRVASGHAYEHVYPGPVGSVFAPGQDGVAAFGHLAYASTLCGACEEVCPVKIPIPDMLLRLRSQRPLPIASPLIPVARNDRRWRALLVVLPQVASLASGANASWFRERGPMPANETPFRRWWNDRS